MEQIINMPRIGDKAPDFEAVTTTGPLKLSDYNKDSWILFFSHPADFTPVCTTEMSGFALEQEDFFTKHHTKLLGLSIDSVHSHLAWVDSVKKSTGIYFQFPIVADIDMKVSKLYGMLQPNESETQAVRAVFFIDPAGVIRLIMYYPMSVGRNMHEIKRVLLALQTNDKAKVSLPLNWEPGEKVIVPAPKTLKEYEERLKSNYEMTDWYLAKKTLDATEA